jgi:hypothetical protein
MTSLEIVPLQGLPLIAAGDDLTELRGIGERDVDELPAAPKEFLTVRQKALGLAALAIVRPQILLPRLALSHRRPGQQPVISRYISEPTRRRPR